MLKRLLLLIAFVALPASAGVIPDRIATAVADRIAAGELPSAVVAMIVDGKTEIRGFGALADGKAPDADTLFEIGSISKTFTATLLAEAAVKGEVKIDEPLRDLLPTFAIPSHDGREITLADIAEQHSGLPRMPDNFRPKDPGDPFADYSSAKRPSSRSSWPAIRCRARPARRMNIPTWRSGCSATPSPNTVIRAMASWWRRGSSSRSA
jgi:CubicO group peptidase (beta-lactamase class C family)